MENIQIAISFATQSPTRIDIDNTSSVLEALSMAGIEEIEGQDMYIFHKGKLISNHYLSLSAYNVRNNDCLYIAMKRRKDGSRARQFLESLQIQQKQMQQISQNSNSNNNSNNNCCCCLCCCNDSNMNINNNCQQESNESKKRNKITTERRVESFRLTDLAFSSWETIKVFPRMLDEMLKAQETRLAAANHFQSATNLNFMSEISEEPLPGLGFVAQNERNGHTCGIESI